MTITELLDRSRRELLDLSTRNRLLAVPLEARTARLVRVVDELSREVYRILVEEKRSMSFLPCREGSEEESLPQPEEASAAGAAARRHRDARLQTDLSSSGLQTRLLDLHRDARTTLEEQGVNILYLALGHLKWFEAEDSEVARYAPLVLIPVSLTRASAAEKFELRWTVEDLQPNLCLEAKLKADFGLELPTFEGGEEWNPAEYFGEIRQAVKRQERWRVQEDTLVLGFFSFAKLLMFRDLDASTWPTPERLTEHPLLAGLLQDGFPSEGQPAPEGESLDARIPVERLDHVVDADSSQTLAIEAARAGRNLVIQGPPGTGKSQSITNIITTAVQDGKKVLFVAEKQAALEVVKRRLENAGLGPLCLELHSTKASKKAVLEELGRTLDLGRPKERDLPREFARLATVRETLNQHCEALHRPLPGAELSPYEIMGQLALHGPERISQAANLLPEAAQWTAADRQTRRDLMGQIAERWGQFSETAGRAWKGCRRESFMSFDLPPLRERIGTVSARLQTLPAALAAVASGLGLRVPSDLAGAQAMSNLAKAAARPPDLDTESPRQAVWWEEREQLRELLAAGLAWQKTWSAVGGWLLEAGWERDLAGERACIAHLGPLWWRWFAKEYRAALKSVRAGLRVDLPERCEDRVALLDRLIQAREQRTALRAQAPLGTSAMGRHWLEEKTDWKALARKLDWFDELSRLGAGPEVLQRLVERQAYSSLRQSSVALEDQLLAVRETLGVVCRDLALDCPDAFGVPTLDAVPLEVWQAKLGWMSESVGELALWATYSRQRQRSVELGLKPVLELLESGGKSTAVRELFDAACLMSLWREVERQRPWLAAFDGLEHNGRVRDFRELDQARLQLARYQVLTKHHAGLPAMEGAVGAVGIIRGELGRKRGHRAVRQLLKDAGSAVQAIKPVFMMSPLSVAQFLAPGAVEFDLLVIDEASQVQPVDALGAIARSRQLVVVGDSRQLPPSRFFMRMTTEEPEGAEQAEETVAAEARDMESILGLCSARGLSQTMLRWHYRSRHHSLIAVSNHEFYEDRLFIVPSPHASHAALGLKFRPVADGVFDSGASGTNRPEARAICREIIRHARETPDLTLGVAAFSVRQQQAILDELELLRREHPELESFFYGHPEEPFFVKNLENIQGDERDIIFISIGYARDADGYMAMRFGPLSMEGGERRLNVLISRARSRCEVFSSITADDIDLSRAGGRGVAALKSFLNYAAGGRLETPKGSMGEEQSPMEESVRRALVGAGHEVHTQVGMAGFFIDLAVVDPAQPGRYLLGIECDGATYHSSRSSRDRDRLRQSVLEAHGWQLHRVWSTDWFARPENELRRIQAAIVQAGANSRKSSGSSKLNAAAKPEAQVEREEVPVAASDEAVWSGDYTVAEFSVPRQTEPHRLPTKEMARICRRIVECEGPMPEDEVSLRVRDLWGMSKAGGRIVEAVAQAIRSLLLVGQLQREEGFVQIPGAPVVVRNRATAKSPTLRKVEALPPCELREALREILRRSHGCQRAELAAAAARAFGFGSVTAAMREAVAVGLSKLVEDGTAVEVDGLVRLK